MQTHPAASSRDIFSGNLERSAPSIDRLLDHVELVDNVNKIAKPEGSRRVVSPARYSSLRTTIEAPTAFRRVKHKIVEANLS